MIATLRWLGAVTLALAATGSVTAAAPVPEVANSGLVLVPATAPVVIQVHGIERTKDRATAMLTKALPDLGPVVAAQIDSLLKNALEGRKLQGIVKDAPLFMALMELPGPNTPEPNFALVVRVTRYADFRDGLLTADERKNIKSEEGGIEHAQLNGKDVFMLDRKDYAVMTSSKDAAVLIARKPESLADKLDSDAARGLMGNDYSVYINIAAVNKQYGEDIRSFRQLMESVFDAMPAGGGIDKSEIEMIKSVYGGIFQAIDDGRTVVAGLDFRPEGLALHAQAQVGAESKTNTFLKGNKPAPLAELGALPGGQTMYTGMSFSPAMLKALGPIMYGLMGGEGDARKQAEAALQQMIAAGQTASYSGANFPPAGVQVLECQDPATAMAAQLKLYRGMMESGSFQNTYLKGKPEIKENAQEYKGFKLNYTQMTWDLDKFAAQMPGGGDGFKAAIKKLMGESVSMWFGADTKRLIVVTAPNWDAAKAQIDAYLGNSGKLSQEPAYKMTRQQLPADTTMIYLADAGKLTYTMGNYMLAAFKAMPLLPIPLPDEIKPVRTETSYIGGAVTLKPERGSFDMFIPVAAVLEIRKLVMPLFAGGGE